MQFSKIPNFQLDDDKQKEIVDSLKKLSGDWSEHYKSEYDTIRRIRAAKNCRNYNKPVKSMEVAGASETASAPDIHIPDLKNAGNIGVAEIERALFTDDYLQVIAVDPQDKCLEDTIKKAMYALIEQTNTDKKNIQIAENIWYEGTCPVVITNEGRINAHHEVVYRYEIPITEELKEDIQRLVFVKMQVELQKEDPYLQVDPSSIEDIGKKIVYKMEEVDEDGIKFNETVIKTDTDLIIETFVDDESTEETSLDLAENFLQQMGIDFSQKEEVPEDIKTVEEWIEGFPRPKILNLLDTVIEPASSNEDEDTLTVVYKKYRKTQELYDTPDFIEENKEKLKNGTEFIGKKEIDVTDKAEGEKKSNYEVKDPHVVFRQAYFHEFRFKNGDVLRNFLASSADDKILLEAKPNMSWTEINGKKYSQNPFILYKYYSPAGTNIGSCPAMDMEPLSEAVNKLFNYGLDMLSRGGNRWAKDISVEYESLGSAGSFYNIDLFNPRYRQLGITDIKQLIQQFPNNTADIQAAFSQVPFMEAKLNQSSNTSQSYFNDKDDQTATEIATVVNQASGTIKSVINNIAKTDSDVKQRLFEECVNRDVKIDLVTIEDSESGEKIIDSVDFGDFKGKKFLFKLSSTNPELSNSILAKVLTQSLEMSLKSQHPEVLSRINISEIVQEIMKLHGVVNPKLIRGDKEAKKWLIENDQKEALFNAVRTGAVIPKPNPAGQPIPEGQKPDSPQPAQ